MSNPLSLNDLLAQMQDQDIQQDLSSTQLRELNELLEQQLPQPWYIKALIGIGAWLGSWLFMAFIIGISISMTDGGYMVLGILFLAGSLTLCYSTQHDFPRHVALSVSLAGQLLIGYAVAESSPWDDMESYLLTLIFLNLALVFGYPDRVHRFLSVLFIGTALMPLLYKWELQALIPFISPILLAAFVLLSQQETRWYSPPHDGTERGRILVVESLLPPIMNGLLISSMAWTMLSTIYILPELEVDFVFYPSPWISSLGILAILCLAEWKYLPQLSGKGDPKPAYVHIMIGGTLLLGIATLNAPGILLSLTVLFTGTLNGHRFQQGLGIAFFVLFLTAFFYAIETTLLMKSIILVSSGLVVLLARKLIARYADIDHPAVQEAK